MDFRDVISLVLFLIGVVMLIIAQVLKHKGMWDLRNDDLPSSRGTVRSPYDFTNIGIIFMCMGIVSAVGFNFGLKAGGWAAAAVGAVLLILTVTVRLRRADKDDKDEYYSAVAAAIISGCALAMGLFLVYIA